MGLVSYQEHSNFLTYNNNGASSYWSDYGTISKDMEKSEDSADVAGLEIEKIMETGQ